MTEKEDKKRINRLEETVKHLILARQDKEKLAAQFDAKITLEDFAKRDYEHKSIFQKFLNWMAG